MNENQKNQSDIGVVGLAVMGQNLILNMNDNGYVVSAYNRTTSKVDEFIANEAKDTNVVGVHSLEELVSTLKSPRKIMLMIKAGDAVDQEIDKLIPLLEKGDIIIDGGNSLYTDTIRREKYVSSKGLLYVGTGVSGGEEGARRGPSIMPGGSPEAWPYVKDIFQKISAKVDNDIPCCDWVGQGGAGHYVKMVHNGIEYGDMQLICEAYDLLKKYAGLSNDRIAQIFDEWNKGELDSYLIEITADILAFKDNNESLIDKIMDTAGQKGTGKWTVVDSAQLGQPVTLISEAVFARCLSSIKDERVAASAILQGPSNQIEDNAEEFIESVRQALYAAKIVSYAQGYMLMRAAAKEYGWDLNYGGIALMWRGGCIIRSRFLGKIKEAYETNPALTNLLIDPFFVQELSTSQESLRKTVATASLAGIPLPAMSSALSFYDGYRSEKLPANLLQAQRDYFGAHTYERIDTPKGEMHHTNWTGQGGTTSSGSYNV
ncbi:MAG: decarboxylating NADP(+)-dependent phosphogluconate dehydrogenase [bacterium]